jgi:catechol 2,3-dioxygenase-like lactoylglutathione lyase family enzyme
MATFTGFHHLALATGDMDRTIRFWRDLIGLNLVAGLGKPGGRQYFFELAPGALLGFFEWPGVEPLALKDHGYPARGPFAFDHLAISVQDEQDLWELKDRLEAAGFWVSEPIDHAFIHSIYSFDPNGIPIEFASLSPRLDLHVQPRMVDREASEVTREGAGPQPGKWPPVQSPTPTDQRRTYPGEGLDLLDKSPWRQ